MLSLSMIVRNEAAQIEACLCSVQDFADELVVVDTGSTDDTVDRARAWGRGWSRSPGPATLPRPATQALQSVSGDWALVLDADERLRAGRPGRRCGPLMAEPDVLLINLLRHERGAVQSP
jgi:glycosyltransferase involved in cell wall biosynthesis